jgi:S-adenosylmethionine decarboxylase
LHFEGPEKKVEIILKPNRPSLRTYGKAQWEKVVHKSRAQILSEISNDQCTAYLLSESSLFVYDDRVIMITCGRTTLAHAVLEILTFVDLETIDAIFYERKNEHFPRSQPTHFFDDVRMLSEYMPGKVFRFGHEDEHHIFLFHLNKKANMDFADTTLEVLMNGISGPAEEVFCHEGDNRKERVDKLGIHEILPGYQIDEYFFDPIGYSLNAIKGAHYYTIHITPERVGSYVSFETNGVDPEEFNRVLNQLMLIFKPKTFDTFVFDKSNTPIKPPEEYILKREVIQKLSCGYTAHYNNYFLPQTAPTDAYEFTEL